MSLRKIIAVGAVMAVMAATASVASAETLLMPDRSFLAGTSDVVWGITTQPNTTSTYSIDFGDGSALATGTVTDRSYIAVSHSYAVQNTYTVTLTVGAESATAKVAVYDGASMTATDLRNLKVNLAIQDGLRYLWTTQTNRTAFDTVSETAWGSYNSATTALAVQAFQNQGYSMPNNNSTPTGIYPKYAVRRGMNFMLSRLTAVVVSAAGSNGDPCVGGVAQVPAGVLPTGTECNAVYANTSGDSGYENGMVMFAVAGSGALSRTNVEAAPLGGYANVTGQTLAQILQRLVNASAWGQTSSGVGKGGWIYGLRSSQSDGSTDGWELLGLLDAASAGAVVPSWVVTAWGTTALPNAINTDGSFDYNADANPASCFGCYKNMAKTGIGLQGMYFAGGYTTSSVPFTNSLNWMVADWNNALDFYACAGSTDNYNGTYGCAYGMFNVFKGLKLWGVQTLPGIGRAAGPGTIPADDWYAAYVDWLVTHQSAATTTTGGYWGTLYFSGAWGGDNPTNASVALLILAPTALVLPDPVKFGALGLQQGNPLSINPTTDAPGGTHTVTGITLTASNSPIPGVNVDFKVISGPNAGTTGSGTTGPDGHTTFTYTDTGGAGIDNIQAFVGTSLSSNVLIENWVKPTIVCDVNGDGKVTNADLLLIRAKNGQAASGPSDPYDANGDGVINVADVRFCQLRLTP